MTGRVPVTLLAGFLGSGKTTLVNRILSARHGERIAVIVNEFGELGIDGALVVGADEDVVELANGCLCCTVRGDLADAIGGLLARRRRKLVGRLAFDRILIEASGLASPGPVAQTLEIVPELSDEVVLDGVVTLVRAEHAVRSLAEFPEVAEQIGYADRILLNACDLAGERVVAEAEIAVRAANSVVPILRCTRADVDIPELLCMDTKEPGTWKLEAEPSGPHGGGVQRVSTVALRTDRPVDFHALKIWLQFVAARRTHEVLRLKGLFRCEGFANAVVVQGVHQWLELGPGEAPAPAESALVLIGRDLDEEELRRGWRKLVG